MQFPMETDMVLAAVFKAEKGEAPESETCDPSPEICVTFVASSQRGAFRINRSLETWRWMRPDASGVANRDALGFGKTPRISRRRFEPRPHRSIR